MNEIEQRIESAFYCYNARNLPQTEALARQLIAGGGGLAQAYSLLGLVALSVELPRQAAEFFKAALREDKSFILARKNLKLAEKVSRKSKTRVSNRTSAYLLIKAWGYGLWADMDHVLGMLLLAEMTGRTPVIHWGSNSLYHDGKCNNAYDLYFEPISQVSLEDLGLRGRNFFPPKWNNFNLSMNSLDKWEGEYSRMAGLYFLSRDEDVVVSDFHTFVSDLVPWVDERSPLAGMTAQEIYRYLFKKYIRLRPDILEEIERFWGDSLQGCPVLAVHVRGSDKIMESMDLAAIHAQYHDTIGKRLSVEPDMKIFLMTDSVPILEEYRGKYGDRLVYTECSRTATGVGVHNLRHDDRRRIGVEIIKDTYLAGMCDAFIGYGGTNVSTTILHMKEWPEERVTLFGVNQLFQPHLFLHNRHGT